MESLKDLDLLMPLLAKLTKHGREEFWREASLIYPEEIWTALKDLGDVDLHTLKWSGKIPP